MTTVHDQHSQHNHAQRSMTAFIMMMALITIAVAMCAAVLQASCTNGKLAPSDILSMVMGSAMHDAAHPGER